MVALVPENALPHPLVRASRGFIAVAMGKRPASSPLVGKGNGQGLAHAGRG